jgi:hypothetical protein
MGNSRNTEFCGVTIVQDIATLKLFHASKHQALRHSPLRSCALTYLEVLDVYATFVFDMILPGSSNSPFLYVCAIRQIWARGPAGIGDFPMRVVGHIVHIWQSGPNAIYCNSGTMQYILEKHLLQSLHVLGSTAAMLIAFQFGPEMAKQMSKLLNMTIPCWVFTCVTQSNFIFSKTFWASFVIETISGKSRER